MRSRLFFLALVLTVATSLSGQWRTELASPGAAEQLRLGVIAYHQGRFSEALLFLEKSLAYDPGEPLILYWLGLCYHRSGFEATALKSWEPLLGLPDAPPSLRSLVEALRAGRGLEDSAAIPRYVEATRFEGTKKQSPAFLRPSALLAQPDGTFLLIAQGSGQILRMDPNGLVKERISGGLAGLDRPFGLAVLPDGSLFVSEFNGDRVARIVTGGTQPFGTRGIGEGQLLGPQFLASDDLGYLYVCDYGNARIAKFDSSGAYILSIGAKSGGFPGFSSPAGLAVVGDVLFAADSYTRSIYRFDLSGNFLGTVAEGALHFPEGLSPWNSGRALLIADTDRILSLDLETERLDEIYRSTEAKPRLVSAVADNNGNILACDFDASVVSVLSEAPSLAQGYRVEIDRIDASAFPKVRLSISVRDRTGQPVVGLSAPNFYLSETIHSRTRLVENERSSIRITESVVPVSTQVFEGSGTASADFRTILLVDRGRGMDPYAEALRSSLVELATAIGGRGSVGLVLAGALPSLSLRPSPSPDLKALVKALQPASNGKSRFDLGLRQAANALMPGDVRDSILYCTSGTIDPSSFQGASISELGALLANNSIRFNVLLFGTGPLDPALGLLVRKTGGTIVSASRPKGLGDLVELLRRAPSGRYYLSFVSQDEPEFGTRLLVLAVEAYLYQKSGRDELGYYAPLQ